METTAGLRALKSDTAAWELFTFFRDNEEQLGLGEAELYYDFPVLKDLDDDIVISQMLLVSRRHGVIALAASNAASNQAAMEELPKLDENLEHVFSLLYSRLLRNRSLLRTKKELAFPIDAFTFSPFLDIPSTNFNLQSPVLFTKNQLEEHLKTLEVEPIDSTIFAELVSTIEGAKGIIRHKARDVQSRPANSKGALANLLESEISSFDQKQKQGAIIGLDGLQRIRGLAGSGKTVVLAMKAALTHLRYPETTILYTFYTRSLYQHIKRLITRFYRQFDDKDPDWDRLKIIHAWGGFSNEGVYFNATQKHGAKYMSYSEAVRNIEQLPRRKDPFDFVCTTLLRTTKLDTTYDYIFVDEGQDFPASFIQLCIKLAKQERVVFAYDDLQTIFQAATPTINDIVGTNSHGRPLVELTEDIVLYKCYRNPSEIIVCAHALGFGIYGSRIVQMLENQDQWEDIGYKIVSGSFVEGSHTVIERPINNSQTTISAHQKPSEIVRVEVYEEYSDEVNEVAKGIKADIEDGLRPDDILVAVVDDRHAQRYLADLAEALASYDINSNNVHADKYGIRDFNQEGFVTLSTVHKAKGNEAFVVYVVGVDALFAPYAGVRERNLLFTAMTRAKGWVRVSGIGQAAIVCKKEIEMALKNFPNLIFKYPSKHELKILRRDLAEKAIRKQQAERKLDEIMNDLTPDEVQRYLKSKSIKKGK